MLAQGLGSSPVGIREGVVLLQTLGQPWGPEDLGMDAS